MDGGSCREYVELRTNEGLGIEDVPYKDLHEPSYIAASIAPTIDELQAVRIRPQ